MPSSIKLKNEWSYTVTPPCAFTACLGTSLSLQLLLKNGTKHFYSDAQLFTIFHSQTHWNTIVSLTKAIFANKCANVITMNALVPIFLSSIILQKSLHYISWLPTQVTDKYCTHPSLSCQLGTAPLLLLTNEWQLTSSSQGLFTEGLGGDWKDRPLS